MRRPRVGYQPQLVETEHFGHFQRTAQVPDVYRIEGAAENTDAPGAAALAHQVRT